MYSSLIYVHAPRGRATAGIRVMVIRPAVAANILLSSFFFSASSVFRGVFRGFAWTESGGGQLAYKTVVVKFSWGTYIYIYAAWPFTPCIFGQRLPPNKLNGILHGLQTLTRKKRHRMRHTCGRSFTGGTHHSTASEGSKLMH